ncbi:MAG TPA: hemin uptake protein HemP [Burkholderiales bacterium]|nr:hemin uptake protein HemP [Burkholderiales bacterium]
MNTIVPEARCASSLSGRIAPTIASEQLMQGKREIIIRHGLEKYRLRITAAGKLILTK